jgi:hypothetical protein
MKLVHLAYALLAIIVTMLLIAALVPARGGAFYKDVVTLPISLS